jgi:hypothetical protein
MNKTKQELQKIELRVTEIIALVLLIGTIAYLIIKR